MIFKYFYSLDSSCCFQSDNNATLCTDHFCDKSLSHFFIVHPASFAGSNTNQIEMGDNIFL